MNSFEFDRHFAFFFPKPARLTLAFMIASAVVTGPRGRSVLGIAYHS